MPTEPLPPAVRIAFVPFCVASLDSHGNSAP